MNVTAQQTRIRRLVAVDRDAPDWKGRWIILIPALMMLLQLLPVPFWAAGIRLNLSAMLALALLSDALTLGLVAKLLCRGSGKSPRSLGLVPTRNASSLLLQPILGLLLCIPAYLLAQGIYMIFSGGHEPPLQNTVRVLSRVPDLGTKLLAVAAVGIAAPIAEEIVFRGVVFRGLRWRMSLLPSLLISAAVFSLAHLDVHHALHVFALGLVLAWLVERTHSIYPSMILHGMINLTSLLLAW